MGRHLNPRYGQVILVSGNGYGYGHVITKFSRMGRLPHFLSYGAPSARGWSSAMIN